MLASRLRHRVAIQQVAHAQDAETGEMVPTWSTLVLDSNTEMDSVPAEIFLGPGRESGAASAAQASVDARITLRWFPGLTQHMRILWDGRIFNIESLETDLTGREEWRIKCSAGVNEGDD